MDYTEQNDTYFATPKDDEKDRIQVEIGDSKQSGFFPQLKIARWDNEVNVSLRLVHEETTPVVSKQEDTVKWERCR